jgi:uncharacterized protein
VSIWLLDTGPIVTHLVATEPDHAEIHAALLAHTGDFVTTSVVIAEAMHLLRRDANGAARLVNFLEVTETQVFECCQRELLRDAVALMQKYEDTPMDFGDATLVLLGAIVGTNRICTIDRRGFQIFRTRSGKAFDLVLDHER